MTNIRYDEFLLEMFFFRKYRIAGSGDKVELFPLSEQMFLHLLHQQSNRLGANSILLYDDDDVGDGDGGDLYIMGAVCLCVCYVFSYFFFFTPPPPLCWENYFGR